MIVGIGVDLVTVSRIGKVDTRHAERFERRILTQQEKKDILSAPDRARFLAKRFAVKEAAVKAIGTGEREGVLLSDIGLSHDTLGKPELQISGEAAKRCKALGVSRHHVSLSDEGDLVTAFVVLESA
jgi:holo-[acyl-carrier protein] synthase